MAFINEQEVQAFLRLQQDLQRKMRLAQYEQQALGPTHMLAGVQASHSQWTGDGYTFTAVDIAGRSPSWEAKGPRPADAKPVPISEPAKMPKFHNRGEPLSNAISALHGQQSRDGRPTSYIPEGR